MRKLNYFIPLILLLITSCEKEENSFPVGFYAPVIHGYMEKDDFGIMIGLIGINDSKNYDPSLSSMKVHLNSYPNPFSGFIALSLGEIADISKKIWIVPANASDVLSSFLSSNYIVAQGQPVFTLETTSSYVQIDLHKFPYKFYRVYVRVNNVLLWDNIVKK